MTSNDAGNNASGARTPIGADVPPKPSISPAARKFAEYLARRMLPKIAQPASTQHPRGS
jgi:hypothetical protein